MLYAGFYNLSVSDKAARDAESRRSSANTTTSSSAAPAPKQSKSTFKKIINQLKATDEEITPEGIYAPIIKRGPLFQGLKPAEKAQEPTPIYQRERPLFSFSSGSKKAGSVSSQSSVESVVKA